MILSNLNNLTIFFFVLFLFLGSIILFIIYRKSGKYISGFFLFLSLFFILINLFEIKGGFNQKIDNVEGGKIVFALDVSKSMDAQDVGDNGNKISRLELSKILINSYISNNKNNYYGLIIFAGEAIETVPFTNDRGVFSTVLYSIDNDNISKNGTNLNSVFDSLNNYFIDEEEGGLVVIFTDGGDENIDISEDLFNSLKTKGIDTVLMGVGTKVGSRIPIGKDLFGDTVYKTYNGQDVVTKLNQKELSKISSEFNIGYKNVSDFADYYDIDDFISKHINYVNIQKNVDYRLDYTRLFIFISFIFFILFLISDNFIGRRK